MSYPVITKKDASMIRMTVEDDAEHVEALALHPVRAAIHRHERLTRGAARTQPCLHQHGQAAFRVLDPRDDLEPLLFPVNRRKE